MTEAFIIYLYTVLSSLSVIAWIIVLVFLVLFVLSVMVADDIEPLKNTFKNKAAMTLLSVSLLCIVLVPSKEDLKFIIGGAVAWNGIVAAKDIEGIEKLPENVVSAMNYFLEEVSGKEKKQ